MPENTIIEELLRSVNKNFDRQLGSFESLIKKLEEAESNGSTKEYISLLSRELGVIENSVNAQKNMMGSVYGEVFKRANKRGEGVDPNVVKDIYNFVKELAEKQNQINQLKEEYKTKGKYTREEKGEITKKIKNLEDEIKKSRDKKTSEYQTKYQKGSAELGALNASSTNKKIKDSAKDVMTAQEGQKLNLRKIYSAELKNNIELKKTQEYWGIIKKSAEEVWNQVEKGANLWMKYNERAISDAKRLGITSKKEAIGYMETLMENSKTLARNFGMTAEQAMKMQDAYIKVTGRAAMLTESQMEDIAAASKLMGEESVQSAMNIMDKMGSTSQTTMELMDKNFVRAANSGLDTVKASEEFVKNMSLANKLNFRNGVDGISKMTIYSQRIKMNLQEVANVADKFSTIEGAIEGSARLQMLGGAGALYGGNPMQMMYEALSDPEALFDRMGKMFGQQAVFDRRTGESKIDPVQMQIIREQAKAMGMNPDEAIQSAKQQAKLNAIESDFTKYASSAYATASDEQKAAIQNKAEYDKEKQTWVIKYMSEEGEERVVDIKNLTEEERDAITKDNVEDVKDIRSHVRKIASELVGTKERWNSMKDQFTTGVSQIISPIIKGFDSALSFINNSALWSGITGGGVGTALGLGAYGMINGGIGLSKLTAGKWINKKGLNFVSKVFGRGGGEAVDKGNFVSDGGKNIEAGKAIDGTKKHKAGLKFAKGRKLVNAKKVLTGVKSGLRFGSKFAAPLAVATEVGFAAWDFYQAGQERKAEEQRISQRGQMTNGITGRKRFTANDIEQQRIKADNKETEAKGKAIGAGSMALAGAGIGFSVGGPWGAAIGAALGGAIGAFAGGKLAPEKQGDIIAEHIKEIEKGDEEDNFKKIVLPVESIDYNVSLIANQLGILTASPARNNVYLEAEVNGEIAAEGKPLEASSVNEIDTYSANSSQMYHPSGPLTLNVNGSIDLNMKGTNIGKLTAEDFKQMFNSNPELQRQIAQVVTNRQISNGNANKFNNESSDNRRGSGYNMYTT